MRAAEIEFLGSVQQIWASHFDLAAAGDLNGMVDMFWTTAEQAVWSHLAMGSLIQAFQSLQQVGISFLFPQELKTHRCSKILAVFVSTLMVLQGFLQARFHRHKRWAARIAYLAVDPLRDVLIADLPSRLAVHRTMVFLRNIVEGEGSNEDAVVYCLFSSSSLYVGKALVQRAGGKWGIPSRIMEHLTAILRKSSPSARTTRAILFRKCPIASVCFLPVKHGRHEWIKASESVAIRATRPQGNEGQCKSRRPTRRRRARRRPPPRFRASGNRSLWSLPFCLNQVIEQVRQQKVSMQSRRQPLWTVQTLRDAYRSKQQWVFAKSGKIGPISIYSKRNGGLLALWACEKGSRLNLSSFLRHGHLETTVLRLARLVAMVQGYIKRNRGFAHVDKLLKRFQMPSRRTFYFRVSSSHVLRQVKGAVRLAAKTTAARRGSALYAWIMEKSKFVAGKGPSFADRRNVVQAAKNISISSLWSQGLFAIQHWLRGEDLKQMPGNWSVIDRLAEGAEHAKVKQNLQLWLREKNIRRHPSRRCLREYRIGQHLQQDVPPVEEEEYTKRLEEHPKNCVLVPDDKDKKRTWAMPFQCMTAFLVSLVLLDSGRWAVAPMSPEQLSALVFGASIFAVPAFLRKGPLPSGSFAPYMYPFVKAKCFDRNGGRLCQKKNHSCFRKVVSFFRAPWRRAWRLAGRAIQILVIATGAGFSVWRLRDVIPQFRSGFGKLRSSSSPMRCENCQCEKRATCMLVADAAQMYEQVSTDLVLQAFDDRALQLQAEQGHSTITVKRTKSVVGWPGGSRHTRSGTYVVFSLLRLRRMLEVSCRLCFATLGDIVVQSKGLLIGGLLSMVASVCLLSKEEELFLRGQNAACSFIPAGWRPEEVLLGMRYVDDLLLFSSALCHNCLTKIVGSMYSVTFEINEDDLEQTWTDIIFSINEKSGSVSWRPKNPNRTWIQGLGKKGKERFVPYLGRLQCKFGVLRGMFLGRAARLKELGFSANLAVHYLLEEVQELILEGYPPSFLRALVHSFPGHQPELVLLRQVVRDLERKTKAP